MPEPLCLSWSGVTKPVIGMVHLPPLPGSPGFGGDLAAVRDAVLRDTEALVAGGVHGLMLENFGDTPFFKGRVPAHVVSHMTALAQSVRQACDLPLGVNVLRNDAVSALAVASAVGASYIRVNVLCGAALTDQGVIEGAAAEVMRYRSMIAAADVKVFADVRVKHAAPLAERPLEEEIDELVHRARADALIVSGPGTGRPTDPDHTRDAKRCAGDTPVFVGSGVSAETIEMLAPHADGFIIGSYFKQDRQVNAPVDVTRVRAVMQRHGSIR